MLNRRRITAAAAVLGALALAGPVAGANAAPPAPILFPAIPNLGPTGPYGPLGPHGPLGGKGQLPTGWNAWNLGPTGPLGPHGPLGGGH
jgi:hypothetical protein